MFSIVIPAGSFFSLVSKADANLQASNECWKRSQLEHICFTSANLGSICIDSFFSFTFTAAGGIAPLHFTADPMQLPNGMTLDPGGVLSGTPTTSGVYPINVVCTDSRVPSASITSLFTLYVVEIVTDTLPDGQVGVPYNQALVSNPPGIGTWLLTSGGLPAGLGLDAATGVISGTPVAGGDANFTIGLLV